VRVLRARLPSQRHRLHRRQAEAGRQKTGAFDFCGISEGIGCDVCARSARGWASASTISPPPCFGSENGDDYRGGFGTYRRVVAARCTDPEVLARCEDGGVVTGLLAWARRNGVIDGAVVSTVDPGEPCSPKPRAVTTVDDIIRSASSWYTYCPNNLALEEAEKLGLKKVAFVGVPCQITPIRKMQLADASYLDNGRKKEKHIERQRKFLKGLRRESEAQHRTALQRGVHLRRLMRDVVEGEMGIPLAEIKKFNVKGKVLIDKHDGERVEMNLAGAGVRASGVPPLR
jgi:coenzyme F420 hydrogenase subunit beta